MVCGSYRGILLPDLNRLSCNTCKQNVNVWNEISRLKKSLINCIIVRKWTQHNARKTLYVNTAKRLYNSPTSVCCRHRYLDNIRTACSCPLLNVTITVIRNRTSRYKNIIVYNNNFKYTTTQILSNTFLFIRNWLIKFFRFVTNSLMQSFQKSKRFGMYTKVKMFSLFKQNNITCTFKKRLLFTCYIF